MKLPVGTDRRGVIHSIITTDADTADITQLPQLVHGQATTLHGDTASYTADDKLQWELSGGRYLVNKSGKRTDYWDAINRTRSRIRAMVEHPFHIIKRLWASRRCAPPDRGATSGARAPRSVNRRPPMRNLSTRPSIPT